MTKHHVKHFPDMNYTVRAKVEESNVTYEIFRISATSLPNAEHPDVTYSWRLNGSRTQPSFADNLDEAEVFVQGYVKWDGCSNWIFPENTYGCMFHACDKQTLVNIGLILGACHDWTSELLSCWDGND